MNRIQIKKSLIGTLKELCKSPLGGFRGLLLMLVFFPGCKEEGRIDHIDSNAPAPAQVLGVTVRNTAGGAVLKYKLPADDNLLYVKAVYEIQPGVVRETKSSRFLDSLVLEGFGYARPYDVQIFSVGRNEKMSEPVRGTVNPTTPPVQLVTKKLREVFGGVRIDVLNPEKAALAVVLMADTTNIGYLSELMTFYTSAEKSSFAYRGMDTIPYNLGVYVRDRWNNRSDTVPAILTPWFEERIPSITWTENHLPGDAERYTATFPVSDIWDNKFDENDCFLSELKVVPVTFGWDLGKKVQLSRFKYWCRGALPTEQWRRWHIKVFEIYGSNAPNPLGIWDDSWIPLGRFECVKPTPGVIITQEDIDFSFAGIDFDFVASDFAPEPFTPVRYLRWKVLSTFNGTKETHVAVGEVQLWGKIVE